MTQAEAGRSPGPAARILILLACAAGLGGLAVFSIHFNPFGFLTPMLPWLLFLLGEESLLPLAAIPAFFLLWSIPQFRGKPELPVLSILLAAALTLLLAVWFVLVWKGGVEVEGLEYTAFQVLLNAGMAATAFFTARHLRKQPSLRGTVAWQASLVGWFALIGFPYLGETP